jgi:hypothetical protein
MIFTYLTILLAMILLLAAWWVIAELKFGINVEELLSSGKWPSDVVVTPLMAIISAALGGLLLPLGIVITILPIRIIKSSVDGEKRSFGRVLKEVSRRLFAVFVTMAIFFGLFSLLALLLGHFGLKDKLGDQKFMSVATFMGLPIYLYGMMSVFFVTLGRPVSKALGDTKNLIKQYCGRILGMFVLLYAAQAILGFVGIFGLLSLCKLIMGSNAIVSEVVKQVIVYPTGLFVTIAMFLTCINLDAMTGKKLLPKVDVN